MERSKKIKLLICTQAVDRNDPVLGFFHRWIEEFAKNCESVTVICLREGEHDLPDNVRVFSLGKESGVSRLKYLLRFYKFIWRERKNYDTVFVHMNPEYVVLGGWLWRLLGRRVGLWYTHRSVDLKLRIASIFSQEIFTASRDGFRLLRNKNVHVMGHGIDSDMFKNPHGLNTKFHHPLRLVSVGRITPIKNLETAISAVALLRDCGVSAHLTLVGEPAAVGDEAYAAKLREQVESLNLTKEVSFVGSVPHAKIAEQYWENDIAINLCPTGGLDKAVLEAMASGLPVLVANAGFTGYLSVYKDKLLFSYKDPYNLAGKLEQVLQLNDVVDMRTALLDMVNKKTGVGSIIDSIVQLLKKHE